MSRDGMSALQGKRLNKLVNLVYHNVPFYRNKMQEMDLSPDDIQTIEDIVKLPFTTKQDLRDNYPYGLQADPASEIVPFGNTACVVEATGQEIVDALEMTARSTPGENGGFLQLNYITRSSILNYQV